jgi:hypothetical protein
LAIVAEMSQELSNCSGVQLLKLHTVLKKRLQPLEKELQVRLVLGHGAPAKGPFHREVEEVVLNVIAVGSVKIIAHPLLVRAGLSTPS